MVRAEDGLLYGSLFQEIAPVEKYKIVTLVLTVN